MLRRFMWEHYIEICTEDYKNIQCNDRRLHVQYRIRTKFKTPKKKKGLTEGFKEVDNCESHYPVLPE